MAHNASVIIGKTINSVIIKKSDHGSPSAQIFLIFTDDTSYEFWVNGEYSNLSAASCVDQGGREAALAYMKDSMEIVFDESIETLNRNVGS